MLGFKRKAKAGKQPSFSKKPKIQSDKTASAFNPYLHGTTSALFASLHHTDFKMLHPMTMLAQYGIAPMGGELASGHGFWLSCQKDDAIFFGRLKTTEGYTFHRLKSDYANPNYTRIESSQQIKEKLESLMQKAPKEGFRNIDSLLVYIGRAKQVGCELPNLSQIKAQLEELIQSYYLLVLICNYIIPQVDLIKSIRIKKLAPNTYHAFAELSYLHLQEVRRTKSLEFKKIYENPTQEGLDKLLEVIKLPTSYIEECLGEKIERSLPKKYTQLFTFNLNRKESELGVEIEANFLEKERKRMQRKGFLADIFTRNPDFQDRHNEKVDIGPEIRFLLRDIFDNVLNDDKLHAFDPIKERAMGYISNLEYRLEVLEKLINEPAVPYAEEEQSFLDEPFGLVLVCEQEQGIELFNSAKQEYRSEETIQLGSNIKMIAVADEEDRERVLAYLKNHQIANVSVMLYDDLTKSLVTGKRPETSTSMPDFHEEKAPAMLSPFSLQPKVSWHSRRKEKLDSILKQNNQDEVMTASLLEVELTAIVPSYQAANTRKRLLEKELDKEQEPRPEKRHKPESSWCAIL